MKIVDEIYGEFIVEGILEEVIQSKPIQRLKGIHQGGASYLVNPKWNVTRYEHSIGVMLLIKQLGGTVEEQLAGLLHDVSHTAFSHVVDFVLQNKEEDFHETIMESIIENSEIPSIFLKYGLDYKQLFSHERWTLLDQPAPELCADRIDYTLRDMYRYQSIPKEEIQTFLKNLTCVKNKIYISDLRSAEWFVELYYREVIDFFMDPLNSYSYYYLGNTLKLALSHHIMHMESFLLTDEEVMEILRQSEMKEIRNYLSKLHSNIIVEQNKKDYDFHFKNKIRLINPSIYLQGNLITASLISNKIKIMNERAKERLEEGIFVKIISK